MVELLKCEWRNLFVDYVKSMSEQIEGMALRGKLYVLEVFGGLVEKAFARDVNRTIAEEKEFRQQLQK